MAEEIRTGGLKKFVRQGKELKIDPELAKKIDEGYEKAALEKT